MKNVHDIVKYSTGFIQSSLVVDRDVHHKIYLHIRGEIEDVYTSIIVVSTYFGEQNA